MPRTKVVFYRDDDGQVPVLEWLDSLPPKVLNKRRVKLQRLAELGHELRRPEADLLREGVHELRVGLQHVNYRILYFFHGRVVAVLAHGLAKEDRVPESAIGMAVKRKNEFESAPERHTFEE